MIYERGNAAKQWILTELDRRFGDQPARILDLACGDGQKWKTFLPAHPQLTVIGIDTDAGAIERGRTFFNEGQSIRFEKVDAQKPFSENNFDAVIAFSAIEHVVDRPAFLRTVWQALKSGGVAYLNYDAGHFRSRDFKERIMVPISQLLALVGIEGSYMKKVDDDVFRAQVEVQGFRVIETRKHNLYPLKGLMRGASDEAVQDWYAFEEKLGRHFSTERLDRMMWSTTLILNKP